VKLPPLLLLLLMMMMTVICLSSEWVRKIGSDVVGHYDYGAYVLIEDDIVTTELRLSEKY
jgi:hypothetical protein